MKKINKSLPPNPLTEFAEHNPNGNWDDFRNARQPYDDLKRQMLQDQGGICAYCEKKFSDASQSQRIEHFHDKSDMNSEHNWALDWNNVLLVCLGGSTPEDKKQYSPNHLSCDAHKGTIKTLPAACEGYFLNPIHIQTTACLFIFDKATGKLLVNCDVCQQLAMDNLSNQYGDDWCMLAEQTINVLNLNCERLCKDRLEVLRFYNRRIKKYREMKDGAGLSKLSESVFRNQFPEFFTTWRSLLGKHAEEYLQSIAYNG